MWTEVVGPIVLPTSWGEARVYGFTDAAANVTHLAMAIGEDTTDKVLVRVQSACIFGQVFLGLDCDCRPQLEKSLQLMASGKGGILLYLAQEGRGVGLHKKMEAIKLQQELDIDTVEAFKRLGFEIDARQYADAIAILKFLNVRSIRLLTNAPSRARAFTEGGVTVSEVVPIEVPLTNHNQRELRVKQTKLGHQLRLEEEDTE